MKIITINQFYFNKNFGDILKSNNNEIQDNKLGRRPYFLATKYNEKHQILFPFRSNGNRTPNLYSFSLKSVYSDRKYPIIDTTKVIIIENKDLKEATHQIKITDSAFKLLKTNKNIIPKKFNHHINDYIKSKVMENIKGKNNIIKFSTLQYFHKELDLDRKINNKKKVILINELEKKEESIFFKKLSKEVPNANNLIELLEYKNLCQYYSFIDPESDFKNPKLIIRTTEDNFKTISLNTINHLIETNNVSKLNDYFLLPKIVKEKKGNNQKGNLEL